MTRHHPSRKQQPNSPDNLVERLEREIVRQGKDAELLPMAPTIRQAIAGCREHISNHNGNPRSWFTLARLHLLLGQADESLAALLKGIAISCGKASTFPEMMINAEIKTLLRLQLVADSLPGEHPLRPRLFQCAHRLLALARSIQFHPRKPSAELNQWQMKRYDSRRPVLLLAGGCDRDIEEEMRRYELLMQHALRPFTGVVISGGTDAGIAGIAGAVAAALDTQGVRAFALVGYHPQPGFDNLTLDSRYDELIATQGVGFTICEAIQTWVDLIASGIDPRAVRLIGINGGDISALEYRMALALGANVCIIADSGREASRLTTDPHWQGMPNITTVAKDTEAIANFLQEK